jgi:UDP-N-acetylmuramate dehydrogenase
MALLDTLPKVAGAYTAEAPLATLTTFGIGGPAEVLFSPLNLDDLAHFLRGRPQHLALTLLGGGSNILIRDGGIPGVVIHLGKGCDGVTVEGQRIRAEAGASTGKLARVAREAGLAGIEWICGVPGTIGGALVMNAGCYGGEMKDHLVAVEVVTDQGERKTLNPAEVGFVYRGSHLPKGWVFAAAVLELPQGDKATIRERMREVNHKRAATQPLELPNAGSLFKNPPGPVKAWQLIEQAGCRGRRKGDAQVSEKHCNFFVNLGQATAADMEDLAEEVRAAVQNVTGVTLEWEVKRLGVRTRA